MRYIGDSLVCNDNNIIGSGYLEYFEQINYRMIRFLILEV
jgi:hypothetical protein